MATTATKKAPAKKASVKRAPAKKAVAKKAPARKAASKKSNDVSFRDTADKAVNVYLGLIGKGIDLVKENVETVRKDSDKRVQELEKRGVKLRSELTERFDNVEMPSVEVPEFNAVVEDVRAQFNKVQDQFDDAVDNVKEKLKAA